MAKNESKSVAGANINEKDFDWSAFIPKEHKATDLRAIGGLTPIYVPEEALGQKFPPVYGKMDRIEYLPTQRVGQKDEWTPAVIRVNCLVPTKAMAGTKEDRVLVDVAAGEDVLIPITGNLKNNKTLLISAVDAGFVHIAGFRVKGQKDIGRAAGQEMWDWEVMLLTNPAPEARAGRFLLAQTVTVGPSALLQTSSGVPYDGKTGEVQQTHVVS
jgi:hypothetical protein